MKNQKCISCGARLEILGKSEEMPIYRCPQCGLGVTVTSSKQANQYHEYHRDSVYLNSREQFKNIFQKRVEIINRFKSGGRVLEVGSSTGLFLSLLRDKGWDVLGIEPSGTASKVAREYEIPTLNTTFEQVNLTKNSFDLIIFNHVLEHIDDPLLALKKGRGLLAKEGILFIDVPNFASFSARVEGAGWRYILPKEHHWHFTPSSILRILEKTHFLPLYWEAHSGIWGYGSPMQEVWDSLKTLKKRFLVDVTTALPTYILTKLKAGTGLTVVAQKI